MRGDQNERGEILPKVLADGEDKGLGKIEPKWTTLESSLAGTNMEASEPPRISCREIQPTTVGDRRHADGRGSEQGDRTSF